MHVTTTKAREGFAGLLDRAARGGERIVLERRGEAVAAIVSLQDLALIEKIEDAIDVRESRRVLAAMRRTGEEPIPLARVKKDLGLTRQTPR